MQGELKEIEWAKHCKFYINGDFNYFFLFLVFILKQLMNAELNLSYLPWWADLTPKVPVTTLETITIIFMAVDVVLIFWIFGLSISFIRIWIKFIAGNQITLYLFNFVGINFIDDDSDERSYAHISLSRDSVLCGKWYPRVPQRICNTSNCVKRGGIEDLPLINILLQSQQQSWEPNLWRW